MTYLKSWEEFEKAGERLYLQNPVKARYTMKYIHKDGHLYLKLTDDVEVLRQVYISDEIVCGMGKVKKEKNLQEKRSEGVISRKRKNVDKKKNSVDEGTRKYGYISANSVISMAESAGFSGIQEDVARNLAEDVTYRLRYIIQQCKKYMTHCKHKKLSSADINDVLKMCDIQAVYGYSSDKSLHNFIYIKEADVFILDDDVVDIPSFALSEVLVKKKKPFLATGVWLKSESNKIQADLKLRNTEIKANGSDFQNNNENIKIPSKNLLHCNTQNVATENEESETKIPTTLIKYYGITCSTILGHSELKIIFQDLSNSSRIIPIIPYLLNFITISLNKLTSERQLKRLLQTVEALLKNKNIDFTPYSATIRVINALLLIVASDKKPLKVSYDFELRSYAGHVLSLVLSQWCSRDEQRQTIINKMGKLLIDFKASPKVHYGAITLLTFLGPEALNTSLWRILKQYLEYLEELKISSNNKTGNDLAMLEEVTLAAAVSLYSSPTDYLFLQELDGPLNSYFGDASHNLKLKILVNPTINEHFGIKKKVADVKLHSKALKYMHPHYKPNAKKLSLESVFTLPNPRKKNTRIIFKFAGAIPVPEVNLKRRRFNSQYAQFIAGKESEGHVVIAGKCPRSSRTQNCTRATFPLHCFLSVV